MRRLLDMRRLVVASCFSLAFAGAAMAEPAMTTKPTQMRASPSSHAHVVQSIPANAQIDVSGCGAVWCSASWRDLSGFVPAKAVVANAGGAPLVYSDPPPPVYAPPPVVFAPFGCCFYGYGYGWHHYY